MKIAFLSTYSGPVKRGSETYVHEMAERLSSIHDVKVYQLGEKSDESYDVEKVNIDVDFDTEDASNTNERAFGLDYWSRMLARFTLEIMPSLIEFDPDFIVPVNGSWQYDIIKRFCEYSGAKLVITGQWENDNHA